MPTGRDNSQIRRVHDSATGQNPIRVVITDTVTGEVLDDTVSKGGITVVVEDIHFDKHGSLMGRQGIFRWGNPVAWYYAYDRIRDEIHTDAWKRDIARSLAEMGQEQAPERVQRMFERLHEEVKRRDAEEDEQPEILAEEVTLTEYKVNDRMPRIHGKRGLADRDFVMARGMGFAADIHQEDGRWVIPNIESVRPGSGKLDAFLKALTGKLGYRPTFVSVVNSRLREHLERKGYECLD